ncbi:MAG TPA: hypothetical protein VLA91_13030 [Acidimicrobiia bacterium]|nr:hypothetical protein [Acidimicrobiia bacterium]
MTRKLPITLVMIVSVLTAACTGETASTTSTAVEATTSSVAESTPGIAADLALIRSGSARYVDDLDAAVEDGFFIITQMIPDMGYHFLNPNVEGFDIGQPPILVYGRDGDDWELGAVEWVFPEEPAEPPMEGATYGAFPAACHYDDGLFVATTSEDECVATHTETGAGFTFWHPDLVTFHVWAWMHNPDGLYHGTNPLMGARNES